jgi:ribosomal protein S18 acetylase RimI-like enzyme
LRIEFEASPSEQTLAAVRAGMRRHTESRVPWAEYSDVSLIGRDDDGMVIAAALGETGRGWLHVSVVWVEERSRGRRLGTQLVNAMEAEAIRRGCHGAYLDTFSYQARPFYEKLGYEVFGTLENYPPGHQRFYMRKRLGEA